MHIRSMLFACVASIGLVGPTAAADMPAAPIRTVSEAFGWGAFYIGGHAGWAFGSAKGDYTGFIVPPTPAMVFYNFDLQPSGPVVGGHIGYNRIFGRWLIGIEGDIGGVFDARDRGYDPAGSGRYDEIEVLWNAHLRGRLGHAFNDSLIYVAGGLALAGVKASHFAPGVALWSQTDTRAGYSIGAGAERRVGRWRVRIEYLFDHFASERFDWVAGTRYSNSDLSLHTIRAGVSIPIGNPI